MLKKAGLGRYTIHGSTLKPEGQQFSYIRTFHFKLRRWPLILMGGLSLFRVSCSPVLSFWSMFTPQTMMILISLTSCFPPSLTKSAKVINDFMAQNGVSDIWRFKFNNKKVFSFFSNVHHTYTRIDYFLLDNRLLGNVSSCSYHSITISDHGAISFHVALPDCVRPSCNWRLNPLLLADEQFVNHVSSQINFFLETDASPEISDSILWETLKAYLCGQIIEYSSRAKKARDSKLNDISRSIAEIDSHYSSSPFPALLKERLRLQTEYNLLSTDRATYLLTKAWFNVYDSDDKASKLLAQQARQAQSSRLIPKIYGTTGIYIYIYTYTAQSVMITFHSLTTSLITSLYLLFRPNKTLHWEVRSPMQRFWQPSIL